MWKLKQTQTVIEQIAGYKVAKVFANRLPQNQSYQHDGQ